MKINLTRERIWTVIVIFTLCSFAFSQRINSYGLIALGVHWVADSNIWNKLKLSITYKPAWIFYAFFFSYVVFFLLSSHDTAATHAVVSKASLFLFPFFFASENYFEKNKKIVFRFFIVSLSLAFLYTSAYSFYMNYVIRGHQSWYAILNRMSISEGIMHPGYFSNYFMLGVMYAYFTKIKYRYFFISLLILAIGLLLSRIVLLFFIFFILVNTAIYITNSSRPFLNTAAISIAFVLLSFAIYQIPTFQYRIDDSLKNFNNASKKTELKAPTATRRIAYEQELILIQKKPLIGYGLGTANDQLKKQFTSQGYLKLAKQNMQTHNQFLNNWIAMGIIGFLLLVGLIAYLIHHFYTTKKTLAFWFTILVAFNLLTDDMLDIQAGVVFFALVWGLYLGKNNQISSSS